MPELIAVLLFLLLYVSYLYHSCLKQVIDELFLFIFLFSCKVFAMTKARCLCCVFLFLGSNYFSFTCFSSFTLLFYSSQQLMYNSNISNPVTNPYSKVHFKLARVIYNYLISYVMVTIKYK